MNRKYIESNDAKSSIDSQQMDREIMMFGNMRKHLLGSIFGSMNAIKGGSLKECVEDGDGGGATRRGQEGL